MFSSTTTSTLIGAVGVTDGGPVAVGPAVGVDAPAWVPARVPSGSAVELPPIRLARTRTPGDYAGDLGFSTKDWDPSVELENTTNLVTFVRPEGPAARAGLVVGDEVIAVDGHDVVGSNGYLFWALTHIAEGARVTLGLRRGASVAVTAVAPAASAR